MVKDAEETYKVHERGREFTGVPDEFILFQNYPNPFNPGTTIQYMLTRDAHIKLTIYDLMGHEVKVLADEFKPVGAHFAV